MASRDKIFLDTDVTRWIIWPTAIVTRNKTDYSASEIPVLLPDEFLARREPAVE
jgi:hypothetical protein